MRCFEDENGNSYVAWNPLNDAGEAIKEVLEAQEKLSKALAEQINALPAKATAQQQAALEEAMLQCDRRISEIETIILQVTEIAERHINGQEIDEATRTRLGRKLVDLAGEQSLRMHDRTRALEALHAGLDPLVRKLDAYATHGTDTVTKAGLRTLTREIDQARNALAAESRLDDAIAHAERLYDEGKVLDAADWLAAHDEPLGHGQIRTPRANGRQVALDHSWSDKTHFLVCPSYFTRDYFDRLFG